MLSQEQVFPTCVQLKPCTTISDLKKDLCNLLFFQIIWVGLIRATISLYEPCCTIRSCSDKLNSLVKHKIRLQQLSNQKFTWAMFSLPIPPEFSGLTWPSRSSEAIEPDCQEGDGKERRWSVFSLNLTAAGSGLFVSIMCKYTTLFWFSEGWLYFCAALWRNSKLHVCIKEGWESPWGIRG